MNKIIWLTGPSKSGKTTVGIPLSKKLNAVLLDGDELRESISKDKGFSREDRLDHNLRVARLAKNLSKRTNVVISVIAPMKEARDEIDKICSPIWIYCKRQVPEQEGHFYEEGDYFTIDNDNFSPENNVNYILNKINSRAFYIGRWQPFHKGHDYIIRQSLEMGIPVLIGIRDMNKESKNPHSADKIKENIEKHFKNEDVKVIIIPNIRSVNIGRKVGYDIVKVDAPKEIEDISATKIRGEL